MRAFIVLFVILTKYGVLCTDTEAEFWRLPKLFFLDDFERCMARKDGIFCLGSFELYTDVENNPLYDLIQEKSQDFRLYNRSFVHRGYCLPTRCADAGGESNATARFERCVDAWARRHSLRARLHTLHYCRAQGQPPPLPSTSETPYRVYLLFMLAFLLMNTVGTLYDFIIGQKGYRNKYLLMFSIRANWSKLVAVNEAGESNLRGLKVLNGLKAFLLMGAVVAHVGVVTAQTWQSNPRFMEKFLASPFGSGIGSLTTETQVFVLISNFLTSYNLLLLSQHMKIGYSGIPLFFLKRVMRLLPIYLVVNGFTATWFTTIGDGPVWPVLVGGESQVCREKFWPQALFLQNMFDGHKICNIQTWVIGVDVQLYIPSLVITVWLMKRRERAIQILYGLLAVATALTTYVALAGQYWPAFYYMTPEDFRTLFLYNRHFTQFFIMPINCTITMVLGIYLGFMYYNIEQKNSKLKDEKPTKTRPSLIVILIHNLVWPIVFLWSYFCSFLTPYTDPVFMALMIPIERLALIIFTLTFIYTSTKVKSSFTEVLTWRGWRVISRVSMSVSMVHLCVNKALVANKNTLFEASEGTLLMDTIVVFIVSVILAIPMTLLVEYPMGRIMDKLLSYLVTMK